MIGSAIRLAFALAVAAVASQEPEFLQQYAQRIGGAVAEIERDLKDHTDSAARLGLSLDQSIARRKASADSLVAEDGRRIERRIARAGRLRGQYALIVEGGPWERLRVFATGLDPELALATAAIYAPALPMTAEGGVAFGGGFLVGWGTGALLSVLARRPTRRRIPQPGPQAPA